THRVHSDVGFDWAPLRAPAMVSRDDNTQTRLTPTTFVDHMNMLLTLQTIALGILCCLASLPHLLCLSFGRPRGCPSARNSPRDMLTQRFDSPCRPALSAGSRWSTVL